MSRDQRPAKIRVIAGPAPAAHPMRRASDRAPVADAATDASQAGAPRRTGALAMLFIAACAVGGAGLTLIMRGVAG